MRGRAEKGFSAVEAVIILLVIAALGFGAYFVFSKQKTKDNPQNNNAESLAEEQASVQWNFTGTEWRASGTPPACPDPLFSTPLDVGQATSVLYPGQSRGGNYKPHGGFRFDNSQDGKIDVRLPMDAQLTGLVRYIEGGEIQYLVSFVNSCGIAYRFDHLYTLSPAFQAIAETTPEPKVDDTSGLPIQNGPKFKAGELLATVIGHPKTANYGMDFGLYDLRQRNEISKNASWAAAHQNTDLDMYGVCWLDLLTEPDKTTVKNLPAGDQANGSKSDYCD